MSERVSAATASALAVCGSGERVQSAAKDNESGPWWITATGEAKALQQQTDTTGSNCTDLRGKRRKGEHKEEGTYQAKKANANLSCIPCVF